MDTIVLFSLSQSLQVLGRSVSAQRCARSHCFRYSSDTDAVSRMIQREAAVYISVCVITNAVRPIDKLDSVASEPSSEPPVHLEKRQATRALHLNPSMTAWTKRETGRPRWVFREDSRKCASTAGSQPNARHLATCDQLGARPDAADLHDVAVPQIWRQDQDQGRDETRSPHCAGRRTTAACRCRETKLRRTRVRWRPDARSNHRRARNRLPPR